MSDEPPKPLKVISARKEEDSLRGLWPAAVGCLVVAGLVVVASQTDCTDTYHSMGEGSEAYSACVELLRAEFPRYDLEGVEKKATGDGNWSIRFELVPLWEDGSTKSPAVRRCNYVEDRATLVGF